MRINKIISLILLEAHYFSTHGEQKNQWILGRNPGEKWLISDECKNVWDNMSEQERQQYKDRAKGINSKKPFSGPKPFYPSQVHSTMVDSYSAPRPVGIEKTPLKKMTKDEIRDFTFKCIEAQKVYHHFGLVKNMQTMINTDFMFISFSVLSDIIYYDKNYGERLIDKNNPSLDVDYISLGQVNVIPVEVTIIEYSLSGGLKHAYHETIKAGPIPMGYKYAAFQSIKQTHQIPLEGNPDSKTIVDVAKALHKIGEYAKDRGIRFYTLGSEFEIVSQSLTYLAYMSDFPNTISPILLFEDLAIDLVNNCGIPELKDELQPHNVKTMVDAVSYLFNEKLRCQYHYDNGCRYCSMVRVLTFALFFSDHLTSMFGIANTEMHQPISIHLNRVPFDL
ncbi:Protein maelstrom [Thelohanellus kitauei]|uniref:Protein maelstrom n=1 Tax=Thelohanellus kitauei TaxID=669202 RepID=A0A0C2IV32_THEKT|nr:Protein maelstrom [Thelohanellus kitauei]